MYISLHTKVHFMLRISLVEIPMFMICIVNSEPPFKFLNFEQIHGEIQHPETVAILRFFGGAVVLDFFG